MTHTTACTLAFTIYEKDLSDWLSRWGNTYCRDCNARGIYRDTFDPSPSHVSLSPGWEELEEPCHCTSLDNNREQPYCPRCGHDWEVTYNDEGDPICFIAEKGLPCPACGWDWGKNLDDLPPVEPNCFCYDGPDTDALTSDDDLFQFTDEEMAHLGEEV